jgi:hypothetical protein
MLRALTPGKNLQEATSIPNFAQLQNLLLINSREIREYSTGRTNFKLI